jgi:N-acetylneuraminate synthase
MNSTFIIAEIAQAHDGSLGIAHSYIDALSKTGINAIKFQTHIADAESSVHEKFRIQFSYKNESRFEYWKRMEFSKEEWQGLKNHCESVNVEFISTPFSCAAVNLLEELKVKKYKISSGDINNYLLIDKICSTGKDLIISSGMNDIAAISQSVERIKSRGINNLTLLQCKTEYPTEPKNWGLNCIQTFKNLFNVKVGLSDHSGEIFPSLSAVTLGAEVLEFHAVFDKSIFGPDAKASLNINQISELVKGVRQIEVSLNEVCNKVDTDINIELQQLFGKSLCVNRNFKIGEIITIDCLETKKPAGYGIHPSKYIDIIGKRINKDLKKWDFINLNDII